MSILVSGASRVCVQGITGKVGRRQTELMLAAGTRIACGVTPGKGGEVVEGVPVFDSVTAAQERAPADVSILFVPPAAAEGACADALGAGIRLLVLITEGIPVHATMRIRARAEAAGARLIGPATPGVISPGGAKVGIMPAAFFTPGPVGVISRSGTLSYEVGAQLSAAGIGQTTVVGLGADPVTGCDITELLGLFEADGDTAAVVLIGEVGGSQEERAARYAAAHLSKPVVAYIAGRHAVPGVRMGHAGALVQEGSGSAADKAATLEAAGIPVALRPRDTVELVRRALSSRR
ncbi:MAG: succinate--CoA ligase subunit alpha [Gemmatimonadota bacterium]